MCCAVLEGDVRQNNNNSGPITVNTEPREADQQLWKEFARNRGGEDGYLNRMKRDNNNNNKNQNRRKPGSQSCEVIHPRNPTPILLQFLFLDFSERSVKANSPVDLNI